MADQEEREPLLRNSGQNVEEPPSYSQGSTVIPGPVAPPPEYQQTVGAPGGYSQSVTVPPIGPDELPPPYTPPGASLSINCKVCQSIVCIDGKQNQNVIKCNFCNEATPIKAAPPGKKYVRCPCNCLLICRVSANKIACPRANCKRIITLGSPGMMPTVTVRAPNTNRVKCAYCGDVFLFAVTRTPLARCAICRQMSSVDPGYVRFRVIMYLILGLIFLGAGIGVTFGTYEMAADSGGFYVIWIGAFVSGILFLIRSCLVSRIRISHIIGPAV